MKYPNVKLLLSIIVILVSCGTRVPQQETTPTVSTTALQAVIDSIYQAHPNAVGIMAHVEAPDQQLSWSGTVGVANRDTKESISVDQPALIASNTKTYVSAAILRLTEMDKLRLDQPIDELLPDQIRTWLRNDGYDLTQITVAHLMSHTSGVFDYVNAPEFFATVDNDPTHRWTQYEQIELAIKSGAPLGEAGQQFSYADTNYSLLAVIIAEQTGKNFYTAIRDLLNYQKNGLHRTWFDTLEPQPKGTKPLVYQYSTTYGISNYTLDHSFDLYGGGGLAATTKDLARFSQLLFNHQFFSKAETLDLIYTRMLEPTQEDPNYYLGLAKSTINGHTAYGHGGFWATVVQYFPALNASISVFILEKDEGKLRKDVLEGLVGVIK